VSERLAANTLSNSVWPYGVTLLGVRASLARDAGWNRTDYYVFLRHIRTTTRVPLKNPMRLSLPKCVN
jgi:hypothetical protein